MTVTTHITIPADEFDLGRAVEDTGARIELTQFVPHGGSFIPYFWAIDTDNEAAFEASVLNHPAVATLTRHGGLTEKNLYQIEWSDDGDALSRAIGESDVIVEAAAGITDEWVFQVRAPDRDALSAFHDACHEYDISSDIYHVTATPDTAADIRYDFTGDSADV